MQATEEPLHSDLDLYRVICLVPVLGNDEQMTLDPDGLAFTAKTYEIFALLFFMPKTVGAAACTAQTPTFVAVLPHEMGQGLQLLREA